MTATPDPVSPGGQVTYQITVTNQSTDQASSVDVRSVLPAHTDAKEENTDGDCPSDFGDEFGCNAGETIKFDVGDLPAGESAVVSYAAQVRTGDEAPPEGTPLNGNATASSLAGGGASASADVIFGTLDDDGSPTAPTGLTATAADGQASLSWDANSESDLAGYNVYRSPSFFSDPIDEKKLNTSLLSDSSYTDTGVINDSTYYYQVTAVDDAGNESNPSGEVSATPTQGADPPPAAPTALQASGGSEQVSLSWNANSESDLSGYNVYRSPTFFNDPIDETKLNTSLLSDSSYTDTGITSEGTYYYQVTAVDEDGNESGPSEQVSATVSSGPFADWPDLEDPSITFKIVSPEVNVSKVELVKPGNEKTADVSSGFAEFSNPIVFGKYKKFVWSIQAIKLLVIFHFSIKVMSVSMQ